MNALDGKSILVVEDEVVVACMIEDALESVSARVVGPAGTLKQALTLAGEAQVLDAAVLDVNLRGELVDPLVKVLRARSVPIVFTTGYGKEALAVANGESVVEKPYTGDGLLDALRTAMGLVPS